MIVFKGVKFKKYKNEKLKDKNGKLKAQLHICVCMYGTLKAQLYIYIYICMYVCMHVSVCACIYMYVYVYVCNCVCVYICVYVYVLTVLVFCLILILLSRLTLQKSSKDLPVLLSILRPNSTFTTPMSKATLTKSLIVLAQKMRSESI